MPLCQQPKISEILFPAKLTPANDNYFLTDSNTKSSKVLGSDLVKNYAYSGLLGLVVTYLVCIAAFSFFVLGSAM